MRIINLLINIFICSALSAKDKKQLEADYEAKYCNDLELGWNFYCDEEEIVETENKEKPQQTVQETKELTPHEKILKIREELNNLHSLSVLEPTEENIYNYERLKQQIGKRASYVTQATKRVWWKYPELNYLLKRPVSTVGKQVWLDDRKKAIEETFKNLNQRYSLVYFFRSDCSVCLRFSPIIKELAYDYDINLRAVSVDGKATDSFPNPKIDNGEASKLRVEAVPDIFLFDSKLKEIGRIGTGFLSRSTLKERIYLLTKVKVGDDY